MNRVNFHIYFCGLCDETFTDQIMIYKPNSHITKIFTAEDLCESATDSIRELIDSVKSDEAVKKKIGEWGLENLCFSTIYIKHRDYLLGFNEDKALSDIFDYLDTDSLDFMYFIVGGASIHNETGYRFTVHSDERIHTHMPHVHVSKGGVEKRYSLETLSPIDRLTNPHKRDNKRIIVPFLIENREKLLEMWQHNIHGYRTPEIDEDGRQFYSES